MIEYVCPPTDAAKLAGNGSPLCLCVGHSLVCLFECGQCRHSELILGNMTNACGGTNNDIFSVHPRTPARSSSFGLDAKGIQFAWTPRCYFRSFWRGHIGPPFLFQTPLVSIRNDRTLEVSFVMVRVEHGNYLLL